MVQLLAAICFMGALVGALGVIVHSLIAHGDRIAAALNREPQPAPVIRVFVQPVRLSAPRREFSRGPSRQQLRHAAA